MRRSVGRLWRAVMPLLDVDQVLIFAMLAVTVNQLGHYLATFATPGWEWISYFQAAAIDAAIWRCGYFYRRYRGRKQRAVALAAAVFFFAISAWYNCEYYLLMQPAKEWYLAGLMGGVLPLGVFVLSYLYGVKDESYLATTRRGTGSDSSTSATGAEGVATGADLPAHSPSPSLRALRGMQGATAGLATSVVEEPGEIVCNSCHPQRSFAWPGQYATRRSAQNAFNAHSHRNGHEVAAIAYQEEVSGG